MQITRSCGHAELLAACKLALTENHCTPDTDKILYAAIERAERP